jgi:phosphopantothenoylcysteine decarboxylase/phosphopantothenate--cysteine ligase
MNHTKRKRLHILISAGPTREAIDPVRYLSNHSSGKMGTALAEAAAKEGHRVTLVSGPTALAAPRGVCLVNVTTALEMRQAVLEGSQKSDVIFMVAAVADYRVAKIAQQKIKKKNETLTLKLIKNPDILSELGRRKKSHQILVGFAAETHKHLSYAQKKLRIKNLDWIVLNDVADKKIGFGSDENAVTLLSCAGEKIVFKKQSKKKLAQKIIREII